MIYGVEVTKNSNTRYLDRRRYVSLPRAEKTDSFERLADMVDYVNNDLVNGSIDTFTVVRFDTIAVSVDLSSEIGSAARRRARNKLNPSDRRALSV